MSSQGDAFRADCENWVGYKPCDIQRELGLPDCTGCDFFSPSPVESQTQSVYISTSSLATAENIGIVEAGGLGSVLRTTAVSRAIQEHNPDASVFWFTHERGRNLLEYVPGVSPVDIAAVEAPSIARQMDIIVNYELSDAARPIVRAGRSVLGFTANEAGNFYGVLPDGGYMQRLQIDDRFRSATNTLTMQQILLRSVGLAEHTPEYDTALRTENRVAADWVLAAAFPDFCPDKIVSLVVGTSEKGATKRWPLGHFAELAARITERFPDTGVLINTGPDDTPLIESISPMVLGISNVAVMQGSIGVGDYLALVGKTDVVVAADTFGMHAGFSQKVPTVALSGPIPKQEIEAGVNDTVLSANSACSPCYGRCSQTILGHCMQRVSVDEVFAAVSDRLVPVAEQMAS